ncbi:MAG: hypothetical protein Q9224_002952, partial [Gallowayella concinna]
IVSPWGPPVEERPPIPSLAELDAQHREKREAKDTRRSARRKASKMDAKAEGTKDEGPSLKERHTDVVGGPEVVGAEERVVLERGIAEQ